MGIWSTNTPKMTCAMKMYESGNPDFDIYTCLIDEGMTPEQIAEAQADKPMKVVDLTSLDPVKEWFDEHINKSIRGYQDLWDDILKFSKYFVEDGTTVIDIGCSTGRLLKAMKLNVRASRLARE